METMKADNFLEEEFSNVDSIWSVWAWDKVILEKQSTTTIMQSSPLIVFGKPRTKSMLRSCYGSFGTGSGMHRLVFFFFPWLLGRIDILGHSQPHPFSNLANKNDLLMPHAHGMMCWVGNIESLRRDIHHIMKNQHILPNFQLLEQHI